MTDRPLRILWCNRYCLADTSSGASMSVREMLLQLTKLGCEVGIVGATVCDDPVGLSHVQDQIAAARQNSFTLQDGPLTHNLVRTVSPRSKDMRLEELNALHVLYRKALKQFEPDLVWFYGGNCFDYLIPDEARRRGLPVAAYLANGNFTSTRWCEDVDLIVTNSEATRALYRKRLGIDCEVMGTFVPPERFVAEAHARTHLTFVNPRLAKGAGIVAQVAMSLERSRPDIPIEVVESRGRWEEVLRSTSRVLGQERETLGNVTVTPHTNDMRQVYGRSRVVLMPSLWWESSGRVVIEAMLNGIPAIVSDHGGMAEMMGEAGAKISFPPPFRKAPYRKLLPTASVEAICDLVIRFFDDREYYEDLARKAEAVARRRHDITRNARDLRHRLQRLAEAGRALRA